MGAEVGNIVMLVLVGGIVADLIRPSNIAGTGQLVNGFTSLFKTATNTSLGYQS